MKHVDKEVKEAMEELDKIAKRAPSRGLFWLKVRKKVNQKTKVLGEELRAERLKREL